MTFQKMYKISIVILFLMLCFGSWISYAEVAPIDPELEAKAQFSSERGVVKEDTHEKMSKSLDTDGYMGASGSFVHGFIATLSVIVVSELGDKTFFIAAIMAMRHPRWTVFIGAITALALMHIMSAFFGYALTIIPRVFTYYLSAFLFAVFGIKMLKDGWKMSPAEAQEEFDEVQEELRKKDAETDTTASDLETGQATKSGTSNLLYTMLSRIFIQAFTMTFLAEWGDRSQLATIILAAKENVTAVIIAGILGHAFCTGLAVLGGRLIAQRISVRTVTLIGGIVFLLFAVTALFMDPNAE